MRGAQIRGGDAVAARWLQIWAPPQRRRRLALACLLLAMAVAALLILLWGRGQSFFADEWYFITLYRGFSPDVVLHPWGGHLVATGLLIFNGLFSTFGTDSHLPYEVAALLLKLTVGGLVYVLARRRVGELWALVPSVLVLFLGAGWEIQSSSFNLPNELGLAAGLGALVALDRGDLRGDLAASGLLAVSLASFSIALPIAVGMVVELTLARRGDRWRRAWVWLVPVLLYAAWWTWARQYPGDEVNLSNIGSAPVAMFEELAGICAAITGLFRTPGAPGIADGLDVHVEWGRPLALALLAAAVIRLRGGPRPGVRFYSMLAIVVADLAATAMVLGPDRPPNASRYAALGSPLVLLLAVEMVSGLRWPRWTQFAAVGLLAFSLTANVAQLHLGGRYFRQEGEYKRAELAALEIVRGRIPPTFTPEAPGPAPPQRALLLPAGPLLDALDELGSPAFSESELDDAGAVQRQAADQLLGRALRIQAKPVRAVTPGARAAPLSPGGIARHATVRRRRGCLVVRPQPGRRGKASLIPPRGGFAYRVPPGAEARVKLGRFGDGFAVGVAPVLGPAVVKIPADRSTRQWRALVGTSSPLLACPSPAAAGK
jgi:hypothetical protein